MEKLSVDIGLRLARTSRVLKLGALSITILLILCTMYALLYNGDVINHNSDVISLRQLSDYDHSLDGRPPDDRTLDLLEVSRRPQLSEVEILQSQCSNNNTINMKCESSSYICKRSECSDTVVENVSAECMSQAEFIELNSKRKEHLQKQCEMQRNHTHYQEEKRMEMFYFDKIHYGWCPNFKACSSNINAQFCPLFYPMSYCEKNLGAVIWRRSEYTSAARMLPWKAQMTTFITVRDPFSRVLSAYRDKLENFRPNHLANTKSDLVNLIFDVFMTPRRFITQRQSQNKAKLRDEAKEKARKVYDGGERPAINPDNPYENPLYATFDEFIGGVLSGRGDVHWISATTHCAPCENNYDYIIKTEDFTCEFDHFLNTTGHNELINTNGSRETNSTLTPASTIRDEYWVTNKGPQNSETMLYEYYALLSDVQLEQFYTLYKQDCDLFNYDCEDILCKIRRWKETH